jgi:16S rRNA (cytosine1402-N4)-methyltransferase
MHQEHSKSLHVPVLLGQVVQYLSPREGDGYLDLTAGYGGHTDAILERTKAPDQAVLVDRDAQAIAILREKYARAGTEILHRDFLGASQQLAADGRKFDMILADLGLSSPHLNDANRGFAISQDGPLDMRMDQSQSLTAEKIVNTFSEANLAEILAKYGEEPKSKQIARLISQNRPFHSTSELARVVTRAWPGHSKVHPATKTFQALRIAVNDELGQVAQALPIWIELLKPGGRLVIICFHSLEDRLVKQEFAERSGKRYDAELELLTKHPVAAGKQELAFNPRARSAKLRAAAKIKTSP